MARLGARRVSISVGIVVALGIGASIAVMSVLEDVFAGSTPYPEIGRVAVIENRGEYALGATKIQKSEMSWPDFRDVEAQQRSFSSVGGISNPEPAMWVPRDHSRWVNRVVVTPRLMQTLQVSAVIGRPLNEGDAAADSQPAAVVTESLWRHQLAGDPRVVGRVVPVDGTPFTIVGVVSDGVVAFLRERKGLFDDDEMTEYVIVAATPAIGGRGARILALRQNNRSLPVLTVVGRLRTGVDLPTAQREIRALTRRLAVEYPETNAGREASALLLQDWRTRQVAHLRSMLLAVAAFALIAALASAIGLVVADVIRREPEIAVRQALGASQAQLVRLIMSRAMWWAIPGGLLGVFFAWGALSWLGFSAHQTTALRLPVAPRLLLLAASLTLVASLAMGWVGTWVVRTQTLTAGLREAGHLVSSGRRRRVVLGIIVTVQVTAATSLGLVAGLLLRSMVNIVNLDLGFEAGDSFTVRLLVPSDDDRPPSERARFFESVLEQVRALPSVAIAGLADAPPLSRMTVTVGGDFALEAPGRPPESLGPVVGQQVSAGYFEAVGMTVVRGRSFSIEDDRSAAPAMVVDESFCRVHLAEVDPLLAGIRIGGTLVRIVGVVRDVHHGGPLQGTSATVYLLRRQVRATGPAVHLVVRPAGPARESATQVADIIAKMDKRVVQGDAQTLSSLFAKSISSRQKTLRLLTLSAAVVLLLTAFSVRGALGEFVENKTREIALRKALGASWWDTAMLVCQQVGGPTASGLLFGCLGGWALAQMLSSQLFGVEAVDPWTVVGTVVLQITLGLAAAAGPVRRAGSVAPAAALRCDV